MSYYYQQADSLGIDEESSLINEQPINQSINRSSHSIFRRWHVWLVCGIVILSLIGIVSINQSSHQSAAAKKTVIPSTDFNIVLTANTGLQTLVTNIPPSHQSNKQTNDTGKTANGHKHWLSSDGSHPAPPNPEHLKFDWCWACAKRCTNLVTAIEYHVRNISERDRNYKYREIAASLPRFFRGVDHLYLQDFFHLERNEEKMFTTDEKHERNSTYLTINLSSNRTRTIINADQHMFNFGSFHNARGEIIYDMNDFDQVLIGDYRVDLWRTATSIVLHMDTNGIMNPKDREHILRSYTKTYLSTVRSFIGNDNELHYQLDAKTAKGDMKQQLVDVTRNWNRKNMLEDFCYLDRDGIRRLDISRPDLEVVAPDRMMELVRHWPQYIDSLGKCEREGQEWTGKADNTDSAMYYSIKSMAGRVGAGLGSLGQPRYYVLIEGPTDSQNDDILLDIKREPTPEWWQFVRKDVTHINSVWHDAGHRVCSAIHALGNNVDRDVGHLNLFDGSYIVRPRSPWKGTVDPDGLTDKKDYQMFTDQLAQITAAAHSRSDNDYDSEYIPYSFEEELDKVIGDHEEEFERSIYQFAEANAKRVAADFQCYIRSGLQSIGEQHFGKSDGRPPIDD